MSFWRALFSFRHTGANVAKGDDVRASDISGFSRGDYNLAALKILKPHIPYVQPPYFKGSRVHEYDVALAAVANLRIRYSTATPKIFRSEIFGWLAYFQKELEKDRADVVSGASKRELENYRKDCDAENARAVSLIEYLGSGKKP